MNNLPHLVTSLDLSKRLKALGVEQSSMFYWDVREKDGKEWFVFSKESSWKFSQKISAFTAGELGIEIAKANLSSIYAAYGEAFNVPGTSHITALGLVKCLAKPDICALMLCYLIENGLISIKK